MLGKSSTTAMPFRRKFISWSGSKFSRLTTDNSSEDSGRFQALEPRIDCMIRDMGVSFLCLPIRP
jgi:hypothetical protein